MRTALLSAFTLALGTAAGFFATRSSGKGGGVGGNHHQEIGSDRPAYQLRVPGSVALLDTFLGGRKPEDLSSGDAYQLLLPWLSRNDEASSFENSQEGMRKNIQSKLLMDALSLPVMEQLLDQSRKGDLSFKNSRDLFAAYAARDWEKAMRWADGQMDQRELRSAAISLLAETDPDRAGRLYQQAYYDGPVVDEGEIIRKLSKHHARNGHAALFTFMDSLPTGHHEEAWRLALSHLPATDISPFLQEIERRRSHEFPMMPPMYILVGDLSDSHPEEFRKWSDKLHPEARISLKLRISANLRDRGRSEDASRLLEECIAEMPDRREELLKEYGAISGDITEPEAGILPED